MWLMLFTWCVDQLIAAVGQRGNETSTMNCLNAFCSTDGFHVGIDTCGAGRDDVLSFEHKYLLHALYNILP